MLQFNVNSDGVMLYLNGEKEGIRHEPLVCKHDYFDKFVDEATGIVEMGFHTETVLAASEQTLIIQHHANQSAN